MHLSARPTEGSGGDKVRVGNLKRVNNANTEARSWREAYSCVPAFLDEVEI